MKLASYTQGRWNEPGPDLQTVCSAVTGEVVAEACGGGLDMAAVLDFARKRGGPALRALTFHERADMLKRLATHLNANKAALYKLQAHTGATKLDAMIDVDGGIGTLFVYASKGKRELPAQTFIIDGEVEGLSKSGSFVGQHILTPMQGVAVHINAFNFPVWGLLEKLAPAILAGVPVVTKPATITAYVAEALVQSIVASGIVPEGALQFVVGATGDMFDHLTGQDHVGFTGSADTAQKLARHPAIAREAVRFTAERDSLNAAILGPDAGPGTPEFDLFVKEVAKEMTVKAGQKCTAIRRAIVPNAYVDAAIAALKDRLAKIVVGDPAKEGVRMGPVVGQGQRRDVLAKVAELAGETEIVSGDIHAFACDGPAATPGAFIQPLLLHCASPLTAQNVHGLEAFGPVSTIMGYRDFDEAMAITKRGLGSLVASLYTYDSKVATDAVMGLGAFHGRMVLIDRDCGAEQTGHGSPMPQMIHGGPGRAGGGEELGGIRGVHHYLQRTALQGSPKQLAAITQRWMVGAPEVSKPKHPFRYKFQELELGQTFHSAERTITVADIEHFAEFAGDTFYAHMQDEAPVGHPFFKGRVAHGYLLLAFAAGLFVDPAPGPVLANYGLDRLRFVKPVTPGEAIKVRLTVQQKSPRHADYGEVRWDVGLTNAQSETVATYELLTMTAI